MDSSTTLTTLIAFASAALGGGAAYALARKNFLSVESALRAEAKEKENLLLERSVALDQRAAGLDLVARTNTEREAALLSEKEEIQAQKQELTIRMDELSGMTREQAKALFLEQVSELYREEAIEQGKKAQREIEARSQEFSRSLLLSVMERSVATVVSEATTAVVMLPSEEMKGRLIGREGRNIRAFEQVTGVDLIIDDTPEAVVISSFEPIRREAARLTLMNLILDGRIHPARIEEIHEHSLLEMEQVVEEAGAKAAEAAGVLDLPPKIITAMGRLRFRTSLGQNVLDHSVEVSQLCAMMAAELGLNTDTARKAGFLHDIGKGLPPDWEGPHAIAGMEFLKQFLSNEVLLNAVGAHHREIAPESPESELVIIADALSAARPGARRENLDAYLKRLATLEKIALQFAGVDRVFAVQSGRELRVVVKPEEMDDLAATQLAKDIARKVEIDTEFTGTVKITVIRESRFQETAK